MARDLLTDSGSIFVQIGDENVHRVRALLDEVFGEENFVSEIRFLKTTGKSSDFLDSNFDALLWYGKSHDSTKFRKSLFNRSPEDDYNLRFVQDSSGVRRRINESEVKDLWEKRADFFRPNPLRLKPQVPLFSTISNSRGEFTLRGDGVGPQTKQA